MSSSVSVQAAYVLHYTLYGDNHFIVDAFTLEHGRIPLMAKGARASKDKTRALYQPFRPILLSWAGERELRTLTGIEESGPACALEGQSLACAYYLNELLLRLLGKDQPQPMLFAHYAMALALLTEQPDQLELALRQFELQLLEAIGLLPDFANSDVHGQPINPDALYLYYPANARSVLQAEDPDLYIAIPKSKKPAEAVLHSDGLTQDHAVKVSGSTLIGLAEFDLTKAQTLQEIKPLMRRILRLHLGDKPLQSHSMFKAFTPPPPPATPPATPPETPPETVAQSNESD